MSSNILKGLVILLGLIFFQPSVSSAQDSLRTIEAVRVDHKPKIDGSLDDEVWKRAKVFDGYFYQLSPDNGADGSYQTKVMVLYNSSALYIGAFMSDPDPASLPRELSVRDDLDKNVDAFGVIIDPYLKGQNAYTYSVSAAGVQEDALVTPNDFDDNWDAVWNSAVSVTDDGWIAEIEIPYSAIRFPKKEDPVWGLNFYRMSKRLNEESTWNYVDQAQQGFINQSGELHGLHGIKPALRLSLTPFLTTVTTHDGTSGTWNSNVAGGMDLKYGINESFTLDVSLVPDFSQTQSDNVVLNLTPFEVRFDENRPFFTEGLELFNKGRIFYSRRVGQSFGSVDESTLLPNEVVESTPTIAPMINATKISGRTKHGLGIGFFNAMTNNSYAHIRNTSDGSERKVLVDPFTNFNVIVFDQNLKNNSNVGIINTNVMRRGEAPDANVTLADFRIRDKSNTWSVSGNAGYSQVFSVNEGVHNTTTGFKTRLFLGKVSGKIQFNVGTNIESDTWQINDLGFQRVPNEVSLRSNISYNVFKPFKIFNRLRINLWNEYNRLYNPNVFANAQIGINANTQFKNFHSTGFGFRINPTDNYDYFEPRVEGRFFRSGLNFNYFVFYGTDSRKPLLINAYAGQWFRPSDHARTVFGGLNPTFRVNNNLNVELDFTMRALTDGKGYVTLQYDSQDQVNSIIFGLRDQRTYENLLAVNYTFNNRMALSMRIRHYWSWVKYGKFYNLQLNGSLVESSYNGYNQDGTPIHNTSFNAFNIDMVYSWQIAPGSFVTAVWKNSISGSSNVIQSNFFENFNNAIREPAVNSFSIKLIYYIDSSYFRKK